MDFFRFDDEYVRRLREGDRETEEHYFDYFNFPLTMKLRGRVPSADIDDVIQDVHSRLFKELRQGKGVRTATSSARLSSESATTSCTRPGASTQHRRARGRFLCRHRRRCATSSEQETKERVHSAIAEVEQESARDGAILRDIFLNEKDKDEICRDWGVDRDYLRVLVYRALKKFTDKYDDRDDS